MLALMVGRVAKRRGISTLSDSARRTLSNAAGRRAFCTDARKDDAAAKGDSTPSDEAAKAELITADEAAKARAQAKAEADYDQWLMDRLTRLSMTCTKDLHALDQESQDLARDLETLVARERDAVIEANRKVSVATWRVLVVLGTFGGTCLTLILGALR